MPEIDLQEDFMSNDEKFTTEANRVADAKAMYSSIHNFQPKPHPYKRECCICGAGESALRHRHQSVRRVEGQEERAKADTGFLGMGAGFKPSLTEAEEARVQKAEAYADALSVQPHSQRVLNRLKIDLINQYVKDIIAHAQNLGDLDRGQIVNDALQIELLLDHAKPFPSEELGFVGDPSNFAGEITDFVLNLLNGFYRGDAIISLRS